MSRQADTGGRLGPLVGRAGISLPLLKNVFLLWLATRIGYALVTYFATTMHLYHAPPEFFGLALSWQRWDANWYTLISRAGYFNKQSVNFFPLYPMALGAVSWLLGDASGPVFPQPDRLRLIVGMVLSNLGLLVGLCGIGRLAQLDNEPGGGDVGVQAVRLALAYPFAMAWTIAYAEGFFLAFAALTLLFARRGRWSAAAATAFLAGLTRPVAVILLLPLAWEYGRQHGCWQRHPRSSLRSWPALLRGVLVVSAVPAAFLAYCTYVYRRFGDFFLPMRNQFTYWQHVSMPQWQTFSIALSRIVHKPQESNVLALEVALLALYALLILISIRRLPFMYTLYMAGLLFIASAAPVPAQTDLLWGASRYLSQAIPIYVLVAGWAVRRPWLDTALFGIGLMMQGLLTVALFQSRPIL